MNYPKIRIGVFDSGIGGFSILSEIIRKVPNLDIDYISDDAFAPYGEKTDLQIVERCTYITDLLLERGCSLVVVACNSATAAGIAELRTKYSQIPFVGVEPYLNVLNHKELFPAIRKAAVITTPLTGTSLKFHKLRERLDPEHLIPHFSMPNLATIVEKIFSEGVTDDNLALLKVELRPLKELDLSHLILGCTHYPLIASLIEDILKLSTISPGPYVANRVKDLLANNDGDQTTTFNFLSTREMSWGVRDVKTLSLQPEKIKTAINSSI